MPQTSDPGGERLLGEWLVSRSLITRGNLFDALCHSFKRGCRLGDALVELGLLGRDRVVREVTMLCATYHRARRAPLPLRAHARRGPSRRP